MGISGNYVDKFADANLASAVNVHMDGDYDFFFNVVRVELDLAGEGEVVHLQSQKTGDILKKFISRKDGREFVTYLHRGVYQEIYGGKAERVKVVPFKGSTF